MVSGVCNYSTIILFIFNLVLMALRLYALGPTVLKSLGQIYTNCNMGSHSVFLFFNHTLFFF